ncbi:MAG: xanthine dehydrogenase family protein molybdopterin-binding subunit [Limnobacter sp.]|nr:xanthine dehydrogenase family protein molybdopterin-binding subunit [Limnobacter sp.]
MDRRSFLVMSSLASGGLMVGCASPARQELRASRLPIANNQIALNAWVKVGQDSTVTVVMCRSEMGQGVHTALMMLVAEELDCDWAQMTWEQAPIDPLYGNIAAIAEGVPFRSDDEGVIADSARWVMRKFAQQMGFMMTGGSASVRDMWLPMRHAAASTRAVLLAAVAKKWRIRPDLVGLTDGQFYGPAGMTATLGDAVKWVGPSPQPADTVRLKDPKTFKLLGKPMKRLESLAKVEGTASFGIDVRPPGMVFAAVKMSPARGGTVKSFDAQALKSTPGVLGVVQFSGKHGGSGGVAVVADGWWKAKKALGLVQVNFDDGKMKDFFSAELHTALWAELESSNGFGFWKKGEPEAALKASPKRLEAEYAVPYLAHATMEPMNCTVQYLGTHAIVWAPTQVPDFARNAAAKALGLSKEKVEVRVTYLGGGFGRRLESDVIAQAAEIAKQFPNKPVQVIWSREDDMRHDFYRPACVARFKAGFDAAGNLTAWTHVSAGQGITGGFMSRNAGLPVKGPDKTSAEGGFDTAYEFPNVRMGHVNVDLPVPVGFWRAVGHSHQAFFKESFIDECAHAAGKDPYQFRRNLLLNRRRELAVLDLAAKKAGLDQPLSLAPDGSKMARGIAMHECFGSAVAQVVEASVNNQGEIKVHRVVCAIDCGFAVNPNTVAQQIESSVIFGLSAALYGQIDFDKGQATQGNFNDYMLLRLNETPLIETHIVPSALPPEGVGEPGLPPVAPALANAIFALTGKRLRELPLKLGKTA